MTAPKGPPEIPVEQRALDRWSMRFYGVARKQDSINLPKPLAVAIAEMVDAAAQWRAEKGSPRTAHRLRASLDGFEELIRGGLHDHAE